MISPGLNSVTTRALSIEKTIQIAVESGLRGIEWEGLKHVRPGDIQAAEWARDRCSDNNLHIPSYGSYYRAGISEGEGTPFHTVLETAKALSAPNIRIWAGNQDYDQSNPDYIRTVVEDTLRIAEMASGADINLVFEFHVRSLTNNAEYAIAFARQIEHPRISFSWQPLQALSLEYCEESLTKMLPLLSTIHVFHWDIGPYSERGYDRERFMSEKLMWYRHPLENGFNRWKRYFELIAATGRDHWAFLEFTRFDCPKQVHADAKTLLRCLNLETSPLRGDPQ